MQTDADTYVETSVARTMIPRMHEAIALRCMAVFKGPPGIGKTTAIHRFRQVHSNHVAVFEVDGQSVRPTQVLNLLRDCLASQITDLPPMGQRQHSTSPIMIRRHLASAIEGWKSCYTRPAEHPPLTVLVDEAQNLHRTAIEELRSIYDRHGVCFLFFGNDAFALEERRGEPGALTAAVQSRCSAIVPLELRPADVTLWAEKQGLRADAARSFTAALATQPWGLDLRQAANWIARLQARFPLGEVDASRIREAFGLAARPHLSAITSEGE